MSRLSHWLFAAGTGTPAIDYPSYDISERNPMDEQLTPQAEESQADAVDDLDTVTKAADELIAELYFRCHDSLRPTRPGLNKPTHPAVRKMAILTTIALARDLEVLLTKEVVQEYTADMLTAPAAPAPARARL